MRPITKADLVGGGRNPELSPTFCKPDDVSDDPSRHDAVGTARVTDSELEAMLSRAAEEGARRALSDVGLGGKDAVLTAHDMRSLLECIQFVRRTAVHVITTGVLIALLVATKLRWFAPNP